MSIPDFVLDKRVVQRNIAKGLLTRDEHEKSIAKLPDVEDNAAPCLPDPEEDVDEAP